MFVIYSKDYFLLNKQLQKVVKQLQKQEPYLEIINYSWLDDDVKDIVQNGNTVDLFGNNKLLIIKDCYFLTEKKEPSSINNNELALKLLNFNEELTKVIFVLNEDSISKKTKISKEFQNRCEIINVPELNESTVIDFIIKKLNMNNKEIDYNDAEYLVDSLPMDMTVINNELNKLNGIASSKITKQIIEQNISKYSESHIFDLVDYFLANDVNNFLNELKSYSDLNNDLISLLYLLANNLAITRDVLILKNQGKSEAQIASLLSAHPYRVKMIIKKNNRTKIELINDKIEVLYNLNKLLVQGLVDSNVIPELQLLKTIERK